MSSIGDDITPYRVYTHGRENDLPVLQLAAKFRSLEKARIYARRLIEDDEYYSAYVFNLGEDLEKFK